MKYLKYITNGALFALLLAGCSDDLDNKPVVLPVSGDEIEFGAAPGGFTDVNPESRTIYDVPAGSTFDNYQLLNMVLTRCVCIVLKELRDSELPTIR